MVSLSFAMSGEGPSQGRVRKNYKLISNQRGQSLLHVGYVYRLHRKNKDSTVWACVNKRTGLKCSGQVKLVFNSDSVQIHSAHSPQCEPDTSKNDFLSVLDKIKNEVCEIYGSMKKIYEKNVMKLGKDHGIPDYKSVKHRLNSARKRHLGLPKIRFNKPSDVIISDEFKSILLVHHKEKDNTIIIFASDQIQNYIKNVEHYFCDGTFDCCAKPVVQIYTIHGDIGSDTTRTNIVPMFYVLLENKETSTYETMLRKIEEALPAFRPTKFTMDIEASAMNAVQNVYPHAKIHGCFIHFQRRILRKAKSLGLLAHEETTKYVKQCMSLAFLPVEDIEDGWLTLMEDSYLEENVIKFNDYFVAQWLQNPAMIQKWCCYNELHRTTNLVEAWNQRLQQFLGTNPNLISLIQMIEMDISTYDRAQQRFRRDCNTSISQRKKKSIENDNTLAILTKKYQQKVMSLKDYLQETARLLIISKTI